MRLARGNVAFDACHKLIKRFILGKTLDRIGPRKAAVTFEPMNDLKQLVTSPRQRLILPEMAAGASR